MDNKELEKIINAIENGEMGMFDNITDEDFKTIQRELKERGWNNE